VTEPARVEYYPPGPVGAAYLVDEHFVCGIRGPIGSGKSVCSVMKLLRIARRQPKSPVDGRRHSRFAIIRNTFPELKTTTIKTWHAWVPQHVGKYRDEGPPCHHIIDDDLDMEVLFIALDRPQDVRKLLSLELTAAWINEAREVPKAILDGLTGRVGRFPDLKHGGCNGPQVLLDTNAPDTDHWWYRLAEEATPDGFAFHAQPSGLCDQAENQHGLSGIPGGYLGYYTRASQGKDPNWVKVYVHGNYGYVLDGKPVYPEYNDQMHVGPVIYDKRFPVYVGLDFGLTPAATFVQPDIVGRFGVFDELVTGDMGAVRFAELLKGRLAQWGIPSAIITGDPAGDSRAQTDEKTPYQILEAAGLVASPAETNDFVKRREAVVRPLSRLVDGRAGLILDPRCVMLRKAMAGAYHYRRLQVIGAEAYRDVPDKGIYSHVAESLQYGLLGAGEGRALIQPPRNTSGLPVMAVGYDDPIFG
jgi:hypothetical protein